jgi:tRNA U38,U39,U40 pseudouridine synthase TruA
MQSKYIVRKMLLEAHEMVDIKHTHTHARTHAHTRTYIYIYITQFSNPKIWTCRSLSYWTRRSTGPGFRNSASEEESLKKLTVDLQRSDKTMAMSRQATELLCPSFNAFTAWISTMRAACYLLYSEHVILIFRLVASVVISITKFFKQITFYCQML